ncbi:MAG TPA: hypothetical protein VJU77_06745 [Chthoniobacterales bacterium]|nr:hypothetical protein [Chthoniobacterales bacterium]
MSWFRFPKAVRVLPVAALVILQVVNCVAGESQVVPAFGETSNAAKNLARMNCGTTIDLIGPNGRAVVLPSTAQADSGATALIMDDDTLSYPLPEGDTTFVLTFPDTSLLDRFTFVNENATAEGDLQISVSNYRLPARSSKWVEVNGSSTFTGKRLFNLSLLGVEARYVRLSFHVGKGGRIAALGLYGGQSLQKFAARQRGVIRVSNPTASRRLEDMLNFNFANVYAQARVVFVSSGSTEFAKRMIDDDVITSFQFAPADPHPTVIVELAEHQRLHRVSALYKMQAGRLDVFLLQELAENPGDLSHAKPIASVTDASAGGKAAVNFDPEGARFVALRWTPAQAGSGQSFDVAELSAFGDMPLSMLSTTEFPDFYADASMTLERPPVLPQPPVIPVVSP